MKATTFAIAMSATVLMLEGCSVTGATNAYHGAKVAVTAKESAATTKTLRETPPLFQGVDSIHVSSKLIPEDNAADVTTAFSQAVAAALVAELDVLHAPIHVCTQLSECTGKTMSVQFIEGVRDTSLLTRVTMGGTLTGDLDFIEIPAAAVVHKVPLSTANYVDMANMCAETLKVVALRSFPTGDEKQIETLNAIKAIKPGDKTVLKSS